MMPAFPRRARGPVLPAPKPLPQRVGPRLRLAAAALCGALISWLGLALWWSFGSGPETILPAAVRPHTDAKTGKTTRPMSFPDRESFQRAVERSLAEVDIPSVAERAARHILPSVVHLRIEFAGEAGKPVLKPGVAAPEAGTQGNSGSGVVIREDGTILTNLHVVAAADHGRLIVSFADGSESEARVLQALPNKDLAVIRPLRIPDDLTPATLASSRDLQQGDLVVAVGFPFGIGPSVSAGVVSGLDREFRSPDGTRSLSGLIQFDAAANPGSSGGPLVNRLGEVVGIVTAILNPEKSRTFIGIGFATTMESAGAATGLPPF
jgi:S1-C subfamily serine protease